MTWTGTIDDITARPDGALLRVNKFDDDMWRWRVIFSEEKLYEGYSQTKELAQIRAEHAYRRNQ